MKHDTPPKPRYLFERVDDPFTDLLERAARARIIEDDTAHDVNLRELFAPQKPDKKESP